MLSEAQFKFIPEGTTSGKTGNTTGTYGAVVDSTYDVLVQGMTLLNSSTSVLSYLHIWDGTNFTLLDACNHTNGTARFVLFPNPIRIKKGYSLFASTSAAPSTLTPAASATIGVNLNYMIDKPYNNTN